MAKKRMIPREGEVTIFDPPPKPPRNAHIEEAENGGFVLRYEGDTYVADTLEKGLELIENWFNKSKTKEDKEEE